MLYTGNRKQPVSNGCLVNLKQPLHKYGNGNHPIEQACLNTGDVSGSRKIVHNPDHHACVT